VKGEPLAWTHLVLAKVTFHLIKGEHATLRLTITALGKRVFAAHEGFWLTKTHHFRMTFTTVNAGGVTTHHSVELRS
jgi:hypothetical protein